MVPQRTRHSGLQLAYVTAGGGPPVVLVHGGMSDHRVWEDQIRLLSPDYTVVAWDAPGGGGSDDPPADFAMADYARSLAAVIDHAGTGPAHIVGHSFGGGLALALHAERPDCVLSLTLIGAYAGWKGSLGETEARTRLQGVLDSLSQAPGGLAETFLPTLFAREPSPEVLELIRTVMGDFRPSAAATMAVAFAEADLTPHLPEIHVPTLVLCGEKDVRAPRPVGEALHAAIPGSRLVVIEGVGHEVHHEAPERLARELRAFFPQVGA